MNLAVFALQDNYDMYTEEVRPSAHYVVMSSEGAREMVKYGCCKERYPTIEILLRIRNKIGHPALLGKRGMPVMPDY